MGAGVQCALTMYNMGIYDQVMGGDLYDSCNPSASINRDNGDDINEQNVMNNHYGSVKNNINNEQAQNGMIGKRQSNSGNIILNYQEHWKGLDHAAEHLHRMGQNIKNLL
jgi:hypothetical protein